MGYIYPRNTKLNLDFKEINKDIVKERLKRIIKMQGGDAGFFTLAVHSFVESFLRDSFNMKSDEYSFPDLLDCYRDYLQHSSGMRYLDISVLGDLNRKQWLANQVRHSFINVDTEEARSAASRLAQFLKLSNYMDLQELKELGESLKLWDERTNRWEDMKELKKIGFQLVIASRRNKELSGKLDALEKEEDRQFDLNARIDKLNKN